MASSQSRQKRSARKHPTSLVLARTCARAADDKKAGDVLVLDLRKLTDITDYFVILTGQNSRHISALAAAVKEETARLGAHAIARQGTDESGWVLLDFTDVVVHIFDTERRGIYDLGLLWGDAPRVAWETAKNAAHSND